MNCATRTIKATKARQVVKIEVEEDNPTTRIKESC